MLICLLMIAVIVTLILTRIYYGDSIKEFCRPKDSLSEANKRNLTLVFMFFVLAYTVILSVVLPFFLAMHSILGFIALLLIIFTAVFGGIGLVIIERNFRVENNESEKMMSLGETLLETAIELLIGTIAIGFLFTLFANFIDNDISEKNGTNDTEAEEINENIDQYNNDIKQLEDIIENMKDKVKELEVEENKSS